MRPQLRTDEPPLHVKDLFVAVSPDDSSSFVSPLIVFIKIYIHCSSFPDAPWWITEVVNCRDCLAPTIIYFWRGAPLSAEGVGAGYIRRAFGAKWKCQPGEVKTKTGDIRKSRQWWWEEGNPPGINENAIDMMMMMNGDISLCDSLTWPRESGWSENFTPIQMVTCINIIVKQKKTQYT